MGMYTRLTFWVELKDDSPAVPVIQQLMEWPVERSFAWPDHPFFEAPRAWAVLQCSSYYHQTGQTILKHDEVAHCWWLNVDSSLKNYNDEIELFLDWIAQYDADWRREFRGFFQYEESVAPTLIYRDESGGKYLLVETEAPEALKEEAA